MRETIQAHAPGMICELHETNAAFVALGELGYSTQSLDGPLLVSEAEGDMHVLALPAG